MICLASKSSQAPFFQDAQSSQASIGSKLLELSRKALQESEKQQDRQNKYEIIFAVFTKYISEAKLIYDPEASSLRFTFLSQPADGVYTVNCFVLTSALLKLFNDNKMNDVKDYVYTTDPDQLLKMKPPGEYPGLFGKVQCFDSRQNALIAKQGFALFSRHSVLKTKNRVYFDPTFCCFYKNKGALHEIVQFNTYSHYLPLKIFPPPSIKNLENKLYKIACSHQTNLNSLLT